MKNQIITNCLFHKKGKTATPFHIERGDNTDYCFTCNQIFLRASLPKEKKIKEKKQLKVRILKKIIPKIPIQETDANRLSQCYGIIYLITNLLTNQKYVGQTERSLYIRWRDHKADAKRNNKRSICQAIRKYGESNFSIEVLQFCPITELHKREQFWIKKIGSYQPFGYNAFSYTLAPFIKSFGEKKDLADFIFS